MNLSEVLKERGFVNQCSASKVEEVTDAKKRTVYLGVDPTADSLHVGNLVAYMLARHFSDHGHKIILLVGGGTGLIGDPRDTEERDMQEAEEVEKRAHKLSVQVARVLEHDVQVVNNVDWLRNLNLLEFLRDIGKHFTVNNLIKKEAIKKRLESESALSYTEFAYPLLQAYDFLHLHKTYGCDVQIGGSDQWGNITAGVELVRKKTGDEVYGITVPLIIDKASGRKFGKSEGNAVWLDPKLTSPFEFYQFWMSVSDADVEEYLKLYTLLPLDEIDEVLKDHTKDVKARTAQRTLARSVTEVVHGKAQADIVARASDVLFGGGTLKDLNELEKAALKESAPVCSVEPGSTVLDVLLSSGLAASKREARQFLESKAVVLNDTVITDEKYVFGADDFSDNLALLKRGKRNACLLRFS